MADPIATSARKITQAQAQNLIREYGPFIEQLIGEIKKELNVDITATTVGEIALEYKRRQGGREALSIFLLKLNGKANERA